MTYIELLAPAGSKKALIGAINAGADAVYLAGKKFGARAFAQNFSLEEIKEVIDYAHVRGVLVYITINTLVFNDDLESFLAYTDTLVSYHIDALIIQDFGIMHMLIKRYPQISIHASTQANTHNIHQVKFLKAMGVKRVILARETPIDVIKLIKNEVDIEVEVFIHGALCTSYGGQCQLSLNQGGRSANLGQCAQPCRLTYRLLEDQKVISKVSHMISSKDLMTIDMIDQLIKIGVDSLKIEGRMKRPEYVVQTVLSYKKAILKHTKKLPIDLEYEKKDLMKVFNRQYTKGYLFSDKPANIINPFRPNHLGVEIGSVIGQVHKQVLIKLTDTLSLADGIRFLIDDQDDYGDMVSRIVIGNEHVESAYANDVVKIDVPKQIPMGTVVVKTKDYQLEQSLDHYFKTNFKKVPLWGQITIESDDFITYTLSDGQHTHTIYSDLMVEPAEKHKTTDEMIATHLSKFGDTPYYFETLSIINDQNSFVPAKWLNDLRKEALALIDDAKRHKDDPRIVDNTYIEIKDTHELQLGLIAKTRTHEQIEAAYDMGLRTIFYEMPLRVDPNKYAGVNLIPVLPRIIDEAITIPDIYMTDTLLDHHRHAKKLYGNTFLNVTNIHTAHILTSLQFEMLTLSPELSYDRVMSFYDLYVKHYKKHVNLSMVVYGRSEVMISKHCVISKEKNKEMHCGLCRKHQYSLKDEHNQIFPLIDDGMCHLRMLHHEPLCLIAYLKDLALANIYNYQMDFTIENYHQVQYIIRLFKKAIKDGKTPDGFKMKHTIGRFGIKGASS